MTTRKTAGTERSMRRKTRKLDSGTGEEPKSYNKPILESISDLLSHGRFSDVTFIVGEGTKRIPCHQLFLKARSPVFEVMFSERWNQVTAKEVPLEDVDPETFRKFLQFIYTDNLEANVPEAVELLQLAHKYDVQLLVSKCQELLLESEVELDDAIPLFQTARKYDKIQLMEKVGEMWAESITKLQTLPSFSQLDKETLMYILNRDDLRIHEVDLFRLTLQGAGNQTDATVEESLKDILPLIRFPKMTLNEFTTAVVPTKLLPLTTAFDLFTYFGNDENAQKSLAPALGFSTQERKPKYSILYTALYPKDIVILTTTRRNFGKLKECVQFYSKSQWNRHVRYPKQVMLGFGLSGISVYCPAKAAATSSSGRAVVSFKAFTICLKSELSSSPNELDTVKLRLPNVEEGKMTDINLGTVVPLSTETIIYTITIVEITSAEGDANMGSSYFAKDFGNHKNTIAVSIKNVDCTTLTIWRNQLQGFREDVDGTDSDSEDYYNRHPRLICRLSFQELQDICIDE